MRVTKIAIAAALAALAGMTGAQVGEPNVADHDLLVPANR